MKILKQGERLYAIGHGLLENGYYIFDRYSSFDDDDDCIWVNCEKNNFSYYAPISEVISIKHERKEKLQKLSAL